MNSNDLEWVRNLSLESNARCWIKYFRNIHKLLNLINKIEVPMNLRTLSLRILPYYEHTESKSLVMYKLGESTSLAKNESCESASPVTRELRVHEPCENTNLASSRAL